MVPSIPFPNIGLYAKCFISLVKLKFYVLTLSPIIMLHIPTLNQSECITPPLWSKVWNSNFQLGKRDIYIYYPLENIGTYPLGWWICGWVGGPQSPRNSFRKGE